MGERRIVRFLFSASGDGGKSPVRSRNGLGERWPVRPTTKYAATVKHDMAGNVCVLEKLETNRSLVWTRLRGLRELESLGEFLDCSEL